MLNNLITEFLLLLILSIIIVVNTLLGTFIATNKQEFNKTKFFKGILKAITISICVLLLSVTLELLPIILSRVGIEIPMDLITTLEIILITATAYKKYALDCLDKIKKLLGTEEM